MAKLFKRGRVWYAWVPNRSGKGTHKVSTLCTDKRAAEAVLARLEREAVDPAYAASNRATTQRLVDEYYLSRERRGRSAGTLHHVRVKAGHLVRLCPALAANITHAACEAYIDTRLAEGAMRTTIKKELRVLKAALMLGRKNKLWQGEPDDVIPELEDDYKPRSRSLTPWELVGLCSALPADRAAHVAFIVGSGARWSESVSFRWDEHQGAPCREVALRGTKTEASNRVVPIPPAVRGVVSWALHRAPGKFDRARPAFDAWGNVRRDLAQACAKLGIPPVTPNDLRRTFAMWLREAGVEPQLIGSAMGHTTSRMVERVYGRLTSDALGKLLEERTGGRYVVAPSDVSGASGALSAISPASRSGLIHAEKTGKPQCPGTESNRRHGDFQSYTPNLTAPAEFSRESGVEDSSDGVGGRYVGGGSAPPPWVHEATANLYELLAGKAGRA